MPNYQTTEVSNGVFEHYCAPCGTKVKLPTAKPPRNCQCGAGDNDKGILVAGLKTIAMPAKYAVGRAKWKIAGKPTRTTEQVQSLIDNFCNASPVPCPHYAVTKKTGQEWCKCCGCYLHSKFKMATEGCPDQKDPKFGPAGDGKSELGNGGSG